MNIESIKEIMDNFDPAVLLPDLSNVTGVVELVVRIGVMAGPVLLLVLGLAYFFAAPKEANHHFGYRCYFGMGSVEAWRFTQRLAGLVWGGLGLVLTVIMLIVCAGFRGQEPVSMVGNAMTGLIWQVILVAIASLAVNILVMIRFDRHGELRKKAE
jgi:hypothetical protein